MNVRRNVKKIIVFLLVMLFSCSVNLFADTANSTTPEPYEKDEFPQWAKDIRRSEIITFGSMPFVTTWVTVGYGMIGMWVIPENPDNEFCAKYHLADFPNPLDKSKNIFTEDQIKLVVGVSAIISLGLGITDYFINNSKRNKQKKELQLKQEMKGKSTVTPLTPEEAGELLRKNSGVKTEDISEAPEIIQPEDTPVSEDIQITEDIPQESGELEQQEN